MTEKQRRKAVKIIAKNFINEKSTYINGLLMFSWEMRRDGYKLKVTKNAIMLMDEKFRIPVLVLFDSILDISTPGGSIITFDERR